LHVESEKTQVAVGREDAAQIDGSLSCFHWK
jgi:hypothetical protein